MKRLCIIGVGGTAKDLLSLVAAMNPALPEAEQWKCIGFLDDNCECDGAMFEGLPVIGGLTEAVSLEEDVFCAFAIGSPRTVGKRAGIFRKTGLGRERFPAFIHPQAIVAPGNQAGRGSIVFPGAVASASVAIGDFVVMLPNSVASHDSGIGEFSCIATGACISGGVQVGRDSYIGANAALRDGVSIGDGTLVGLGAAVVSDLPARCVAYGVPAKPQFFEA